MAGLQPERVKAATAWRFTYLVVQGGSSTILFVWLAQVLPPEQFAAAAVAQGVLVIAQAVGDFGLSQAAVSALPAWIARSPKRATALIAGAARAFLAAAVIALGLSLIAALVVPPGARVSVALIAPAAAAMVIVAAADGLLRAVGEFGRPVRLLLASRVAAFAAVPAAIVTDSADAACAALSVGTIAGSAPAATCVLSRARRRVGRATREVARAAVPLGISQVLIVAGGRLNTVLASGLATVSVGAAFEGAWRLYQLGLYVAGGFATAVAPFIGHALGTAGASGLRQPLMRAVAVTAALGGVWTLILLLLGPQISDLLFGEALGPQVGDAVTPLALVTPLGFVAFLAMMTLAASDRDRHRILAASAIGAAANVALAVVLIPNEGAWGASTAAAAGTAASGVLLCGAFVRLITRPGVEEVHESDSALVASRRGAS